MRKKVFLITLITLCFGVLHTTAQTATLTSDPIVLEDEGSNGGGGNGVKPRILFRSVEVVTATVKDGTTVEVSFNAGYGAVELIVKDNAGIIYHQSNVSTSVGYKAQIDISTLEAGTYTLIIKSADEELHKSGNFNIN